MRVGAAAARHVRPPLCCTLRDDAASRLSSLDCAHQFTLRSRAVSPAKRASQVPHIQIRKNGSGGCTIACGRVAQVMLYMELYKGALGRRGRVP